jgi:hypothetical protein
MRVGRSPQADPRPSYGTSPAQMFMMLRASGRQALSEPTGLRNTGAVPGVADDLSGAVVTSWSLAAV